jgi:hypothetical protein
VFPNFNLFDRVFDQVTANHGVLCLDRTQKSGKLEDMVKFYRATPNPPAFRLGKEVYWALSEIHSQKTKKKEGVITIAAS